MRYQVPQFIGVEDKIFGPFTIKQAVYIAGGLGGSFVLYKFLNFYVAIFLIVPVLALAAALAFYKINDKPFVFVLEAAFKYFFSHKLYIWKKAEPKPLAKQASEAEAPASNLYVPKLSDSKLKDLAWSLDIQNTTGDIDKTGRDGR